MCKRCQLKLAIFLEARETTTNFVNQIKEKGFFWKAASAGLFNFIIHLESAIRVVNAERRGKGEALLLLFVQEDGDRVFYGMVEQGYWKNREREGHSKAKADFYCGNVLVFRPDGEFIHQDEREAGRFFELWQDFNWTPVLVPVGWEPESRMKDSEDEDEENDTAQDFQNDDKHEKVCPFEF